ncbi:uncharacterized protein [Musca autumnalis]|uniref:uncharacterized protein n=1 Tax=Musca autumnalis TaxID=221902 RepID=UPI003CF16BC8
MTKIFQVKMLESFCIKTEPITKDCEPEDCNNNTNTLRYNTTKVEHFTNILNDIKEDGLDLDRMEEFLPEKVGKVAFDIITEEGVDEMEEFLPEDSPSIYSSSSLTWKSDDCTKAIIHDEVLHERGTQQHPTNITTQQISLPKLEIIDVHEGEPDSKGIEVNDDKHSEINDNKEDSQDVCMASNNIVQKCKKSDKICQDKNSSKCEICGRCYRASYNLLAHIRNKHPSSIDPTYICEICHKRFTTQKGLTAHSYQRHPVASEHKCEICGRCHTQAKGLRLHMKNKHPEAYSAQTRTKQKCELCDCSYTRDKTLRAHMRDKHPSFIDSEHICEICHKGFTTHIGLTTHLRMHPEVGSIQISAKHNCEICGRCFTENYHLQKHMRNKHPSSTGYDCTECGFRSNDGSKFLIHLSEAHRQTKYKCPKCDIIMKTHSGLIKHLENHKHQCPACGKCYKEIFDLTIHIKWSHPNEKDELRRKVLDCELSSSVMDIIELEHFD